MKITRDVTHAISSLAYCALYLLLIGGLCQKATSQIPPTVSQFIGVNQTIVDENGSPLLGTDKFSYQHGIPSVVGDLVQILSTTNDTIYPPAADGTPDSRNPVIATTRIGAGVSPALARSGKFSSALKPRPGSGTRLFVRVFNSPNREEATFYGDSEIFVVSSVSNTYFKADIAATDIPLALDDFDKDGLNDSLERSQGSDPNASDTDGDGYNDAEEYVAGTDSLNENSVPLFTSIKPAGPGLIRLEWWPAASGRTYKIYHTDSLNDADNGMNLAGFMVSTGNVNSIVLTNTSLSGAGTFLFRVSR